LAAPHDVVAHACPKKQPWLSHRAHRQTLSTKPARDQQRLDWRHPGWLNLEPV